MSVEQEAQRLESISGASLYAAGPSAAMVKYSFRVAERHLREGSLLEMGPAEGVMTDLLVASGRYRLTVVEGSKRFCEDLRRRHPGISVVHSLFETFEPQRTFDNIVLGHVLEHVEQPVALLQRCKGWLAPGGRLFAAVPNARSLHRQAAVTMGLLPAEDALNQMDIHHGHRRVFNPESFRAAFVQAGLAIDIFGGYWLKPVSNQQIEQSWTSAMLDAFMSLGERYPDIAAENYVLACAAPRAATPR